MGRTKPGRLARAFDMDRIQHAIEAAERASSGEIVVSVAPFFLGSVRRVAEQTFERLGVSRTRERNGVLFFVVPSRRQLVVLGDVGIHEKVGQEFWEELVRAVSERFKAGDGTEGIVSGIGLVGQRLAEHFPHAPDDRNELPDQPVKARLD